MPHPFLTHTQTETVVEIRGLNYSFGQGDVRKQALYDIDPTLITRTLMSGGLHRNTSRHPYQPTGRLPHHKQMSDRPHDESNRPSIAFTQMHSLR